MTKLLCEIYNPMVCIYVLLLDNNKYYVGKTSKDVNTRFKEHLEETTSSTWISLYKPIKIVETFEMKDIFDEDNITKKYMCKYGIENVRGGVYCKVKLDDWQIKTLEHEFTSMSDKCYNCSTS